MNRRISVTLENLAMGFKKAEGLVYRDEDGLVLELQQLDAILELYREEVKTYRIAWTEIDSVTLTKKWFRQYLVIEGKNMTSMQNIPGVSHASLKLKVNRDDKEDAKRLVSNLQLELSEQKLRELDQ
jgi:hypothetical protein